MSFINEHFVPFTVNIADRAGLFGRFDVVWTPTVLVFAPKGVERWRMEGYLDRSEFDVWLRMGLGRVAFMAKAFAIAEEWYDQIATEHWTSRYHPEAMYWRAVCQYSQSHEAAALQKVADELHAEHPDSLWALRTNAWLPEDHPANRASLR